MLTAYLLTAALLIADPVPTVDQAVAGAVAARKEESAAKAKREVADKVLRDVLAELNAKLKELGLEPVKPEPIDPPRPVDPLVAALRTAYAGDFNPADPAKKREALADLIEVYKQAQGLAKTAELGSVAAVIAKVKAAAAALGLTATDLAGVRTLIGAELKAAFPADAALDDAGRAKLAAAFGRIHTALSQVAP